MTFRSGRVLLALTALVLTVSACTPDDPTTPQQIVSATHTQQQALPDFDSSSQQTTDPAELDALEGVLSENGIAGDATFGEDCPGGRSTDLEYVTEDGEQHRIEVRGCDRGDAGDAIDALIASWRGA